LPKDHSTSLSQVGLVALEQIQSAWNTTLDGVDVPLISGLVGHISWDVVSELEDIDVKVDAKNPIPRLSFAMFKNLVVVDHQEASLLFVSNVFVDGQTESELESAFNGAQLDIARMQRAVLQQTEPFLAKVDFTVEPELVASQTEQEFLQTVELAKEHVVRGDVFQVVLSQSFKTNVNVSALDVYRVLRALNPSPYMYLINGQDSMGTYSIVGSWLPLAENQ
jgi:anthranilate synthase component 1